MPTHFRFAESAPDHRLAPWLGRYWEFSVHDGAPPIHYVPPDGCTSLLVATGVGRTPVLVVTGPWLEPLPVPVRPGDQFWGVRLRPGAAGEFLGVDVATLRNNAMPVGQRLGALGGVLAVAVSAAESLAEAAATMDAAFLPLIAGLALPDPPRCRCSCSLACEPWRRIDRRDRRRNWGFSSDTASPFHAGHRHRSQAICAHRAASSRGDDADRERPGAGRGRRNGRLRRPTAPQS